MEGYLYQSHPTADTYSTPANTRSSSAESERELAPSEGLPQDIETHTFVGLANLQKIIETQCELLEHDDTATQFLYFSHVPRSIVAELNVNRYRIRKSTRLEYFKDEGLLIIKLMPKPEHELAHRTFGFVLAEKTIQAGVGRELADQGSTTYEDASSSKEGDSSYRPTSTRPNKDDWPTLVVEAGFSQTLPNLRLKAKRWLSNSANSVKIVVIISIGRSAPYSILVEKWESAPTAQRTTRQNPNPSTALCPTKTQTIRILKDATTNAITVGGAPLRLSFEKIFLRPPQPPEPDNFDFTDQDLIYIATRIWG